MEAFDTMIVIYRVFLDRNKVHRNVPVYIISSHLNAMGV